VKEKNSKVFGVYTPLGTSSRLLFVGTAIEICPPRADTSAERDCGGYWGCTSRSIL